MGVTIRNLIRKFAGPLAGLAAGLIIAGGLVVAQPGQSPNFAWLRGAALGSDPALVCQGLDTNVDCNVVTQGTGTLLVNGVAVGSLGGPGVFSSLTVNGTSALNGLITARPGASVVGDGLGGIVLSNSSTNVTTTLVATETDLFNFPVPANTLSVNNQYLHLVFRDRNAATGNTKQLRMYFGATLIGDTTAVASNNNWYFGDCYIWRTAAATQKAICGAINFTNGGSWATAAGGGATISTPGETLSGAVTVRITGTDAVAAGGSNLEGVNLVWYPAGQ
jgi:hypothetical protein